jgi:ABC-type iron transport system FetAB ATPase subunit
MSFDLKAKAAEKLKSFTRTAAQASSYMTYSTLAAMTLWPVFEAIGKGDVNSAITALLGAGASAGAGLITQKALDWKGKTDAELQAEATRWIDETVTKDDALKQALDAVLAKLDAPQLAQAGLSAADRAWFVHTLQDEARRIGSTVHIEGDVIINGGDFAGRDKIIYNYYCAPTGERKLSEADFKRVLADYLRHVADANQHARLFGETPKSKTRRGLEKIFVPLTLRTFLPPSRTEIEEMARKLGGDDALARQKATLLAHDRRRGDGDEVPLAELLIQTERGNPINKLAVVGGAGSGKSTLLAYLAAMLCAERVPFALPKNRETLVPMIVPFRAYRLYVDECKRKPGMIVDDPRAGTLAGFIPWWLKRRSGLMDASQDFFDRLLRSGGCLLMLDGLDEVVNRDERQQVRSLVEQLVNDTYPGNIVIVTAREAGYREDAVFGDDFLRLDVQPLTEPQIAELVRKWCRELYPADVDDQTSKLMAAITDINARRTDADVPPLISTPLMTTMVVSVKESETELPRERAKLYEACVKVVLQAQYLPDDPDDTRKTVVEWGGPWEDQRLAQRAGAGDARWRQGRGVCDRREGAQHAHGHALGRGVAEVYRSRAQPRRPA